MLVHPQKKCPWARCTTSANSACIKFGILRRQIITFSQTWYYFCKVKHPPVHQALDIIDAFHTLTHHTRYKSSVREISPTQGISDWQKTTLTTDRHSCSGGIRTRNPSKRKATDPRLWPRGHRYPHTVITNVLTFWRRIFFQILAHPVFKMWVIQKPNKVALWNKRHFEMGHLEGNFTPVLYIGRKVPKG